MLSEAFRGLKSHFTGNSIWSIWSECMANLSDRVSLLCTNIRFNRHHLTQPRSTSCCSEFVSEQMAAKRRFQTRARLPVTTETSGSLTRCRKVNLSYNVIYVFFCQLRGKARRCNKNNSCYQN